MTDVLHGPAFAKYSPETFNAPNGDVLAIRFHISSLVHEYLGHDWQQRLIEVRHDLGSLAVRDGSHPTTIEPDAARFGLITVESSALVEAMPGLWELYNGPFKELTTASLADPAELTVYDNPTTGSPLEFVTQQPADPSQDYEERMEFHRDGRISDVFPVEVPPNNVDEGRLVIAPNPDMDSLGDIMKYGIHIGHKLGTLLVVVGGRTYAHGTEVITQPGTSRSVVGFSYPVVGETTEQAESHVLNIQGVTSPDTKSSE